MTSSTLHDDDRFVLYSDPLLDPVIVPLFILKPDGIATSTELEKRRPTSPLY